MNDTTTTNEWVCPRHGNYGPSKTIHPRGYFICPGCDADLKAEDRRQQDEQHAVSRWAAAGIPPRLDNRRFDNFRPRNKALAELVRGVMAWAVNRDSDQGIILLGPPGVGKTHLTIAALAAAMGAHRWRARYHVARDWLQSVRSGYERGADPRAEVVIERINGTALWAMDEIGATTRTEWEREQLGALIDQRYRDGGAFILAGNVSPKELPDVIGERGADRLSEIATVLNFAGTSYRASARDDAELSKPRTDFLNTECRPVMVNVAGVDHPEHVR